MLKARENLINKNEIGNKKNDEKKIALKSAAFTYSDIHSKSF